MQYYWRLNSIIIEDAMQWLFEQYYWVWDKNTIIDAILLCNTIGVWVILLSKMQYYWVSAILLAFGYYYYRICNIIVICAILLAFGYYYYRICNIIVICAILLAFGYYYYRRCNIIVICAILLAFGYYYYRRCNIIVICAILLVVEQYNLRWRPKRSCSNDNGNIMQMFLH